MAGIKETKEQLRNEILQLYKQLTAIKPEELFSEGENKNQLLSYADLASDLSKKIAALGYMASVEETKPEMVIIPPAAEVKAPEVTVPEIIAVAEENIPTVPTPETVPVAEKTTLPFSTLENKQPEPVPAIPVKNFPDVKSFIGFNEKLMFVRSLFNGEGTDYENAIAQVNNCASYKEAEVVLQNFATSNKWSQDAEPVQVLYSIVKRRFA